MGTLALEVNTINTWLRPCQYLDGFWLASYNHGRLEISASTNRLSYRDVSIVFEGVTFFNLPAQWRDAYDAEDDLLALVHPDHIYYDCDYEAADNENVFAFSMWLPVPGAPSSTFQRKTFYVVATSLQAAQCPPASGVPYCFYHQPPEIPTYSLRNRVPHL